MLGFISDLSSLSVLQLVGNSFVVAGVKREGFAFSLNSVCNIRVQFWARNSCSVEAETFCRAGFVCSLFQMSSRDEINHTLDVSVSVQ